jgi:hypothetical protein
MKSRHNNKFSMGIVTLLMLLLIPGMLLAQPSRSPWEMHAGLEVTPENPHGVVEVYWTPVFTHGDPSWYTAAVVPGVEDGGWGPAPNGETIGFGGPSASVIDDAGFACWEAVDYTYFQTFVTVPENTTLDDFTISFSGMDDGARITIINTVYPDGLVIPGSYVVGGGTQTSDLAAYVTTGDNRVVITQEDDCPTGNNLASAVVVLNGETVAVNQAPIANAGPDQAVTRTGEFTDVTLDGSGSSDTDVTDVLIYSWAWTGGTASGVSPTISLAAGTHDIVLTVDDQNGGVDTDNVEVIVDMTPYPSSQTFTVLGAVGNVGDQDPYIQALPEGATEWQQAYLTGTHPWGLVAGTTSWLNFDPSNEVGLNTTTPYRIRFTVPEDATDPSMIFDVKADNRAHIWINDTFVDAIDNQGTITVSNDVAGPALHPGVNEIRINMEDWGGIVGINYRIDVTMTSAEDIRNAVLTPEDAAAINNAPVADAGPDQSVQTTSVTLDGSASSDEDGNLLIYTWSENGAEIAMGVNPTVTLGAGQHTITLTATDGELSSTDDVVIDVTLAPAMAMNPNPADDAMDVALDHQLSWSETPAATGYLLSIGTSAGGTDVFTEFDLLMGTDAVVSDGVVTFTHDPTWHTYNTEYFWTVVPYNIVGSASGSMVWSYTIMDMPATEQTFTVLGANGNVGDQDPYIQALPEGATEWHQAYLTGPHPWGQVAGTNSWINFDSDPNVGVGTTTPYRIRFEVPEDASRPSMVFQVKADNRAHIWINETYVDAIEEQGVISVSTGVAGPALHTGVNEIRIDLEDWGGIVGINYRIDVTMTSAEDISDAVLTPEDAAALNNAPVADAGPDQSVGTDMVTLDGSGSSDDDGNLLIYTWSENETDIATGVNPTITLTEGLHTITLTVTDGELSDVDDVLVDVTLPGGGAICDDAIVYGDVNSPAMAGDLVAGAHDWYSFTTDGSHSQIFISLCNSLGLYDSQLAVFAACEDNVDWPLSGVSPTGSIGHNDDACGVLSEVSLLDLAAGTYYVAVYGYDEFEAGAYELEVAGLGGNDLVDMYEPNDTIESATVAVDGSSFEAALDPTDDSDYFAVTGIAFSTITVETATLSFDDLLTDTWLNLYDGDGNLLASDDDSGVSGYLSMISYTLPSDGTYYFEVVVSPWAAGSVFDYGLNVTVGDPAVPAPQNLVATGGDGLVDLTWDSDHNMPLALRGVEGVSPLKLSNPKTNLHPEKVLLRAIYAEKQAARFALDMSVGIRAAGESCAEAFEYGSVDSPGINGELAAAGQVWYSFTSDGNQNPISVSLCNSDELMDPQLAVFSACGDVVDLPFYAFPPTGALAHNDDACGLLPEISLADLPAGTYYVAVYGYTEFDAGSFVLDITTGSDACESFVDTYEPNDIMGEATPAADGDILNAALCPTEDTDWFAVSALAQQTITFETLPLTGDEFVTDTYLNLYDGAGNLLDSNDDNAFGGYTSMISYELPADGTVYVEVLVSDLAPGAVFDYSLAVTVEGSSTSDLTWNVYRDDVLLASGVSPNAYTDLSVMNGTTYCYTVTQVLADEGESEFSNEDCATPQAPMLGDLCSTPIPLSLPVIGEMGSSDGYNNDYSLSSYMSGIDIIYSFSIPENGHISGSIADAGDEYSAMFVMNACPDMDGDLIALGSGSSGGSFDYVPVMAGDYFLIVSNWPTPHDFTYTFDLTFESEPIPSFDLFSPAAGMMVTTLTPDFIWESCIHTDDIALILEQSERDKDEIDVNDNSDDNSVREIIGYDLYLGTDPDLTDVEPIEVMGSFFTPMEDLMENQVYYWAVSAIDDEGFDVFSDTTSFWTNAMIEAPGAFALSTPGNGEELGSLNPVFSWMSSSDPDIGDEIRYTLIMGSNWNDLDTIRFIEETSFAPELPFEDNTIYQWRVFAEDNTGVMTSNTGGFQSFSINLENDSPSMTDLITPDSVQVLTLTPEMYWTPAVDMDPNDVVSYEMQWWGDGVDFDSVLTDTNAVILPRGLDDNAQYFWQVIAMDMADGISHSETKTFWTDLIPEAPQTFALLSPMDNDSGLPANPTFSWELAVDPDPFDYATYTLQIGMDSNFVEMAFEMNVESSIEYALAEALPVNAAYWWRVIATDNDNLSTESEAFKFTVGTVSLADNVALPTEYVLDQNYPNPFNPSTTIRFGLPEDSQVSLVIYDVRGNVVRTLESGSQSAGWYEAVWDGRSNNGQVISTGLYFARIRAGQFNQVIKMLYVK